MLKYQYIDESRTGRIGVYTGSHMAAIAAAVQYLDAERHGEVYRYLAVETGETYEVTVDALAELGAALIEQPGGDVYSIWCAHAGSAVG